MKMVQILAVLAFCMGCLAGSAKAQTCASTFSSISFGANIDILTGASIDSAGSVTITCGGFGRGQTAQAAVCVGLGNGSNSTGAPRDMASGQNKLAYDLFMDSNRTTRWDNIPSNEPLFVLNASSPTVTVPIYGRIVASQKSSPVGFYLDTVNTIVNMALFNGVGRQPTCPSVTIPVAGSPFQINAAITANCAVAASNMTFPPSGAFTSPTDAQGVIYVTCTSNAPYWLALDGGNTGATDPRQRKMQLGASTVTYGLYSDPARRQPWGGSQYINTVAGSGTAGVNTFPVYGRIPAQPIPPAGTYMDLVTVTVNF